MNELLELPWQIQIVIVAGYFSYASAYSGKRSSHKSVDTLAIILSFGGIGLLTLNLLDAWLAKNLIICGWDISKARNLILAALAVLFSLVCAIVWRRFLHEKIGKILRQLSDTDDDGLHYCWDTLIQEKGVSFNQLNVRLKDGRTLESYPLHQFDESPNGNCVLGGDGSIAMYVTHITEKDGVRREAQNVRCQEEGDRITFIPVSEIAEVDIRRKKK